MGTLFNFFYDAGILSLQKTILLLLHILEFPTRGENAGVVASSNNNAFYVPSIDTLMNKNAYDIGASGNIRPPVFVCIDTAGGGASCTAVCSGVYTKSHSLVVRKGTLTLLL